MDYIAVGSLIVNDMYYYDGSVSKGWLGGAGLYALYGLALWTDEALMVTNVGLDFDKYYGDWFRKNELSTAGIHIKSEFSDVSTLTYHEDGSYVENAKPPRSSDHIGYMAPTADEIEKHCLDIKGMYVFVESDIVFWDKVLYAKYHYGFKIMWEIHMSDCVPENRDRIFQVMPHVDFFSINLNESRILLEIHDEQEIVEVFKKQKTPVLFRVGKKGLYVIRDGNATFCPTIFGKDEVDPTGCGNSSTSAALVALCEGADDLMIGAMANATAFINAQTRGIVEDISADLNKEAIKIANDFYKEQGGNV